MITKCKKIFRSYSFWFYFLLIVGLLTRMFLVIKLPIWHDEFYSVWAGNHSFLDIVSSKTDIVHPPGFYLILHFWEMISMHMYWLRIFSLVCFVLNMILIGKFARQIGTKKESLLLIFLYIFSGYFIIFDWQIRMYTLIDTLILLSLLFLTDLIKKEARDDIPALITFTSINFVGLYIDYAFVWYFVPMAIFVLTHLLLKKSSKFIALTISFFISSILFVFSYPTIVNGGLSGIHGIEWMAPYMKPDFLIPFFLGSHITIFFSIIFFVLFIFGAYSFFTLKKRSLFISVIIFSASFSTIFAVIYSHFATPLLHIRSFQIVGLMVLIFYYLAAINFPKKVKPYLLITIVFCFLVNFVLVNRLIIRRPGIVLLSFFPWRNVQNSIDLTNVKSIKYKINGKLPTLLLFYGLKYTLDGNEDIRRKPIELDTVGSNNLENCKKYYSGVIDLYKCY